MRARRVLLNRDLRAATRSELKSDPAVLVAAESLRRDIADSESRIQYSMAGLVLASLAFTLAGVVVHINNKEKRLTRLFYELDEVQQFQFNSVQAVLDLLSRCHRIWRIEAKSENADWKRNAGASSLVRPANVTVTRELPPMIRTNIPVASINLGFSQMYFLPDAILYRDARGYGAIRHSLPPPPRITLVPDQTDAARKLLGVSDGASFTDVSIAYRRLTQLYHPDKVSGLAPEFQALADKRMKEINAAYEILKQKG